MKRNSKKKHPVRTSILPGLFAMLLILGTVYLRFGGFGTGKAANAEEFAAYAKQIDKIELPENARIVVLGEATMRKC